MVQRQVSLRTTETKQNFKLAVNICKQRIFKLIDLAQEIIGVKVAQKTLHKLLDDPSTKEAVTDDTANNNTKITPSVNQTTLSNFSINLEELSPTQRTRRRLTIRHAGWILTKYNVRRSSVVIFVQTLEHCSFWTRT